MSFFQRLKRLDAALFRTRQQWFDRVGEVFKRHQLDDALWDEIEEILIQADVGVETTLKLIENCKARIRAERITETADAQVVFQDEIEKILTAAPGGNGAKPAAGVGPGAGAKPAATIDAGAPDGSGPLGLNADPKRTGKPYVVLMAGVNGAGKTTTIAKLAHLYRQKGQRVVVAAGDTFRAAAIDQLRVWTDRTGAELVAHQPGADAGAVVFDALQRGAGGNRHAAVVLIDTAGRLQTKFNLMEELKKVRRVIDKAHPGGPDEVLLVLDATTGQNAISQAKHFTDAVQVTGIVLAKLDGSAKGGVVLAINDLLGIPIQYVGTGEKADDLAEFDAKEFVQGLFS